MRCPGGSGDGTARLTFSEEAAERHAEHPLAELLIPVSDSSESIPYHSVGKETPSTLLMTRDPLSVRTRTSSAYSM